ncbi:hypothetical protein [Orenia marismortui]|uniref:Uncharacterized protein n=1 Tax=Orenia marismortui TaxID=46469 RepID=A0A4R8GSF6_9FIRM|nr:hypothetical protein [Orenia marismortui]TDX48862.1 hypothetical protein C7959_12541 [Orenia marismortui]
MRNLNIAEHMNSKKLDRSNSDTPIKLKELKNLIGERELDKKVYECYDISKFGHEEDNIRIKGISELLSAFYEINNKVNKYDIIEKLENVEYIGLEDNKEIRLYFPEHDISASGVYGFSYDLLNELFKMGGLYNYCKQNDYRDILKDVIDGLFSRSTDIEKRYRLIEYNDDVLLRANTSMKYKRYDNNIVMYIYLLALHKYATDNDLFFILDKAHISDSAMILFLEQENPIQVDGLGDVYFSAVVSNSEIKKGKVEFALRYRIVDGGAEFKVLPDIKDSLFSVMHNLKVENLESKIEDIFELEEYKNSMLDYISNIKSMKLTGDTLQFLMGQITTRRTKLSSETKKKFEELYDQELIPNSMNLIKAFDKVSEITADFDEKIYLERLYYKVIKKVIDD